MGGNLWRPQNPGRNQAVRLINRLVLSWEEWSMVSLRWLNVACLVLACAILVGCGAAEQSAGEQPSTSADSSSAAANTSADSKPSAPVTDVVAADRKDDRVSFVRRDQAITKFPGTKLNEAMFEFKLYSDGSRELDGKYTEFWSDGASKFVDGEYKDNIRTGTRKYYHATGELAREVKLIDGKPDGAWPRFREDGSKEMEVSFKNGKRDGLWKYYSSPEADAKAKKERAKSSDQKAEPKAEVKTDKKSPPEVRLVVEGTYKDGRRDGPWITYHPNGQKAAETLMKADRKDGKEQTWFPSGKKMLEAEYKNGLLHGIATMWNEQGAVVLTREYKEGKLLPKSAKPSDQAAK